MSDVFSREEKQISLKMEKIKNLIESLGLLMDSRDSFFTQEDTRFSKNHIDAYLPIFRVLNTLANNHLLELQKLRISLVEEYHKLSESFFVASKKKDTWV